MADDMNYFFLLALAERDIDEEEDLLLTEENVSGNEKQSNFPYLDFKKFNWNDLDDKKKISRA